MIRMLLIVCLSLLTALSAVAGDPFTVAGVRVDAKGPTAIAAQTDAILKGQTRAAARLIERLTLDSDRQSGSYAPPTSEEATRMIRAMSVANEKRSADRYIGDITVAFVPQAVRAFAQARGLTLLETQARTRTVLPVVDGMVVDSFHPWFEAWASDAHQFSLTPVRFNTNDPARWQNIDLVGLKAGEDQALATAQGLLGTPQILIAEASGGPGAIRVRLTDVSADAGTVTAAGSASGPTYAAAATNTVAMLQDSWKAANSGIITAVGSGQQMSMQVTVLYDSMSDWQRLQQAISGAARVRDSRLDALAKTGALMTLTYVGTMDSLASELSGKGARLGEHPDYGPVITRPGYRLP